jgi:hypothetical protein
MRKSARHARLKRFAAAGAAYVPEDFIEDLLEYLNSARKVHGKGVVDILRRMLELDTIEQPAWQTNEQLMVIGKNGRNVLNPRLKKIAPDLYGRQREIDEKQEMLNRELARYRFQPFVSCGWGGRRWIVNWHISPRDPVRRKPVQPGGALPEAVALEVILDLARAGEVHRLRHCLQCGSWLYAKFEHQHYCSINCQQKHYASSELWKAKRRVYMREYRRQTM